MIPNLLNKEVFFDKEKHEYTDSFGNKLISASQLVHMFVPEFDPDGTILIKKAAKEGISPEELKRQWDRARDDSCVFGSSVHASIERFIKTRTVFKNDPNKIFVRQFKKLKLKGKLQSEVVLCSLTDKLAGTTDLIEFIDSNTVNVYDFKTNKKIEQYNFFGTKMLPPFDHYYSTNHRHYSLQMSVYGYMIQKLGLWIENLVLLHFDRKKEILVSYDMPFLLNDVKKMIEIYLKDC